jgi:CRISPR system Cascade subunit CasE
MPDAFFTHTGYRFSLLANPTKKIVDPSKAKVIRPDGRLERNKNSKRVPLIRREDLLAWLGRKAEAGGFAVQLDAVRTIPRGREYFFKPGARGVHYATEFQGALQVTDAARFRETFARGIGSAKAFGFGLLVLAPLS